MTLCNFSYKEISARASTVRSLAGHAVACLALTSIGVQSAGALVITPKAEMTITRKYYCKRHYKTHKKNVVSHGKHKKSTKHLSPISGSSKPGKH